MSTFSFFRSRVFLAVLALGVALVVAGACNSGGSGGQTPSTGETPAEGEPPAAHEDESESATAEIKMVPVIKFDRGQLTIAADTEVSITADNTDNGIPHNFAVYASQDEADSAGDPLASTEIAPGPFTDVATVNLSAGEYFFRCDVHPQQMTGTLIVE